TLSSDSKDETEIESVPKQKEPSFVLTFKHVETLRKSVKKVEHPKQAENLRTNNQKSRDGAKACVEQCNEGESSKFSKDDSSLFKSEYFEEFYRGYVSFGENPKSGKILGKGIDPTWLFDIDTLTKFMNYQAVVVENQPNHNVGIKENLDAENENNFHVSTSGSDKTDSKKHDEKAKRDAKGKSLVGLPTGVQDLRAKFEEFSSNSTKRVNAISTPVTAAGPKSTNNTNSSNTASPSDTAATAAKDGDCFVIKIVLAAESQQRTYSSSITKTPAASVAVEKKCGNGYLKEVVVRRADQKLYKFKEGGFLDLHLNDIEDMLLLLT
nr:hypothetical protein [Tanacetum cinerariifolium]